MRATVQAVRGIVRGAGGAGGDRVGDRSVQIAPGVETGVPSVAALCSGSSARASSSRGASSVGARGAAGAVVEGAAVAAAGDKAHESWRKHMKPVSEIRTFRNNSGFGPGSPVCG